MINTTPFRLIRKVILCTVLCFGLSGCASILIAGLTISEIMTAGSIGSAILTGKGLGEHAMDLVTGQDCRILEAVFRKNRAICEPKDSVATNGDFKGLIDLLDTPAGQDIQLAELPIGKEQLPAINPKAQAVSSKVLTALTGRKSPNIPNARARDFVNVARLTKITDTFDPKLISVNSVATTDLRKRLIFSGVN